jgi:hypothetical protein
MRNVLLPLIVLFSVFSLAQEHPTDFKYSLSIEDPQYSVINDYIVKEMDGTPEELYSKVLFNIKRLYKNPNEVIAVDEEGVMIRMNGYSTDVYSIEQLGMEYLYDIKYSFTFYFKDDRLKLELNNLQWIMPSGGYSVGGPQELKLLKDHKRNGKRYKKFNETTAKMEKYLANLVVELTKDIKKTSVGGSDW